MRTYAGELADERRERRRAALLDAALELVHAEGLDRLAVRRVSERAGLNDRYFYESFASTNELLVACFDRAIGETLEVLTASFAGAEVPLAAQTRVAVEATLEHLLSRPAATTVMLAGRTSPALAGRRRDLIRTVTRLFLAHTEKLQGARSASSVGARLGALALVNGELETICLWLEGEVDASAGELADHVVDAIVSRLRRTS